jgi:hypothetical protein
METAGKKRNRLFR